MKPNFGKTIVGDVAGELLKTGAGTIKHAAKQFSPKQLAAVAKSQIGIIVPKEGLDTGVYA